MIWPQIAVIVVFAMSFGINLIKHGEHRDTNYSVWSSLVSIMIMTTLLMFGGFFKPLMGG